MGHEVKRVLIAGGTGFLGFHSALLFSQRGAVVTVIGLAERTDIKNIFPDEIELVFADLFEMSEEQIFEMFCDKGYDTFIYALGPDDRMTPKAPAYEYFHLRLVDHCVKICRAAKRAGIMRCVIMGSFFAHFDKKWNGKLSDYHPYIRCRNEQAKAVIALGELDSFEVMILELPYIFGTMPCRVPLWKDVFLERFRKLPQVYFPGGGTAVIHVSGVAQAVVAVSINGEHGKHYPVGKTNIKFKDMINYMMASIGSKKHFVKLPSWLCYFAGIWLNRKDAKMGLQAGLDYARLMTQIQSKDLFIDPSFTQIQLDYASLGFTGGESIWKGIQEVMKQSYPEEFIDVPFPDILNS